MTRPTRAESAALLAKYPAARISKSVGECLAEIEKGKRRDALRRTQPRISEECLAEIEKGKKATSEKRPKYGNRIEGRYRSKREAAYARELAARLAAGEIRAWYYEPVSLIVQADETTGKACRWKPDFMIWHTDGRIEFIEIKGFMQRYVAKDVYDARTRYPFWSFRVVAYDHGKWIDIL